MEAVTIEDLTSYGLQMYMYPKDNVLGGSFDIPSHQHTFTFGSTSFYPSASFMYTVRKGDGLETYFHVDTLVNCLAEAGYQLNNENETGWNQLAVYYTSIEGIDYIPARNLDAFSSVFNISGLSVSIGYTYSSHTPVVFTAIELAD
jgi:hypothetical protein